MHPHPHGEWDWSNVAIDAAVAALAIGASIYIVYLLEIVKLANPFIRRREELARAEAPQDRVIGELLARLATKSCRFARNQATSRCHIVRSIRRPVPPLCSAPMEPVARRAFPPAEAGALLIVVTLVVIGASTLVGWLAGVARRPG